MSKSRQVTKLVVRVELQELRSEEELISVSDRRRSHHERECYTKKYVTFFLELKPKMKIEPVGTEL